MTLFIFTEEPSMKEALKHLLIKLRAPSGSVKVISFDGVGNMEKSLPAQLRAISGQAEVRVLILRDNDNGDCRNHKRRLLSYVESAGLLNRAKVGIVCQMLEGWFIGDSSALESSRHFKKPIPKRLKTCDPDSQPDPKAELKKLRDGYNEILGAKAISPFLDLEQNRSSSFRYTIQALRALTAA